MSWRFHASSNPWTTALTPTSSLICLSMAADPVAKPRLSNAPNTNKFVIENALIAPGTAKDRGIAHNRFDPRPHPLLFYSERDRVDSKWQIGHLALLGR